MSLSRDTMPSWELKAALDNLEVEVQRLVKENDRLREENERLRLGEWDIANDDRIPLVKENVRLKEALRNIKERTRYMSCTCSFMVDEEIAKVEKDTK